MDIKQLLGKRIQEIRKSKNITQEHMAELIGIETVSMSNIERGKYFPTAENLNKIINALNVQPSELFEIKHLAPHQELLNEMNKAMTNNENLTRLVYKFFMLVK
ncbi:helix-turn-helix transcriptional regulator [bacterium]|nr:helix-turn-helix transcriptional regulator [bacterium]